MPQLSVFTEKEVIILKKHKNKERILHTCTHVTMPWSDLKELNEQLTLN